MSNTPQRPAAPLTIDQLIELHRSDDGSPYSDFVVAELRRRVSRMTAEELFALPAYVKPSGRHRPGRHRGARGPLIVMPSITLKRRQLAMA